MGLEETNAILYSIKEHKSKREFYQNRKAMLLQQLQSVNERLYHEEDTILKLSNLPAHLEASNKEAL